nr:Chain F, p1-p6 peptide [HIV-1 M:B_ARV2/SF2]4QJ7_G Chain G, p1-p6 peptide [HIV-1 M:B_ARV2/SF2]4QJ9_G Chain G, p1-p6 peptide [HIV-1 M:B_ARV2/SF2]
RPGNFLQSSP